MQKSIIELLVGNMKEKHIYRQLNKRVKALPKDYRFAFRKIQQYLYHYGTAGCDMVMVEGLVELLEEGALKDIAVLDLLGKDVASFCDELILASTDHEAMPREKFNQEIFKHFHRERK